MGLAVFVGVFFGGGVGEVSFPVSPYFKMKLHIQMYPAGC